MRTCPGCGQENNEQARFCRGCGATLPAVEQADPLCASCGAELRPGASFCRECGAQVDTEAQERRPGFDRRVLAFAAAAVLAVVAVAAGAWLLLAGGDGDDGVDGGLAFAEPPELSAGAQDDLAAALAALPDPAGVTDAEKVHSLLGPPDVFQIWFDAGSDGAAARSETWYYLDLEVSYEFRDGVLLFTIPMEDIGELLLVPLRYDPLEFTTGTTVGDVQAMLSDPEALIPEETPAEYGLGVTVWAGEQLMAAFDADGELLYVETVALDLGGGS